MLSPGENPGERETGAGPGYGASDGFLSCAFTDRAAGVNET
jgi:hypothetical protein